MTPADDRAPSISSSATASWRPDGSSSPDGGEREIPLPASLSTDSRPSGQARRRADDQESLTNRTASRSRRIGAEPFSPHSLRHRYTTVRHDAGVPQVTIDYVVGHAPIGTTLAENVEVTPESLGKVRAVLEDAWSSAVQRAKTQFSRVSGAAAGR